MSADNYNTASSQYRRLTNDVRWLRNDTETTNNGEQGARAGEANRQQSASPPHAYAARSVAQCAAQLPVTVQSVLQSLMLQDIRFSAMDAIKYGVFALVVLIMMLYLFPQQLLLLVLLVLLMLFFTLYIGIRCLNIKNRRIDLEKFERLRQRNRDIPNETFAAKE